MTEDCKGQLGPGQFFAMKRIKTWSAGEIRKDRRRKSCTVWQAASHNLRSLEAERKAPHIDQSRTCLNQVLAGPSTPIEVDQLADRLMEHAGINRASLRRDTVWAVEVLISTPPDACLDLESFFACALRWIEGYFKVPVLSVISHMDESVPHLHALLLPLVGGRMDARALIGDRAKVLATRAAFNRDVAAAFGFRASEPGRKVARIDGERRRDVTAKLLRRFRVEPVGALSEALHRVVGANLEAVLADLGVDLPKRSLTEISRPRSGLSAAEKSALALSPSTRASLNESAMTL